MRGTFSVTVVGLLAVGAIAVASPASATETWGAFTISTSGAAGEWILVYQPFPAPLTSVRLRFDFDATSASSDGYGFFVSEPDLAIDWGDGPFLEPDNWFSQNAPLHVDADGGSISVSRHSGLSAGIGGGTFTGVWFLVGSSAPWTLDATVALPDVSGPTVAPEHVSRGAGATFDAHADRALGLESGALAGMMTMNGDLPTEGLAHFQIRYTRLLPDGVRNYDVSFPNGYRVQTTGTMRGYQHPFGGSASSSNWFDYMGTLTTAGPFSARVTYAETHLSVDAAFFHAPMTSADLPPGVAFANYRGSVWPF